MGAGQSTNTHWSGTAGHPSGSDAKTCYYELLNVEVTATDDEIKKAYRKKALELHPDRNYGNVEATTIQFAEVQSAYEVLSDPQERAWYDSHRDAILRGGENEGSDVREHNVHMTTAQEILGLFGRLSGRLDYSDSPTAFFASLRTTFDSLAHEEVVSCEWQGRTAPVYPSFGHSDDEYRTGVKAFYSVWANFATQKSFAWKDVYKYSDAPDRRVRRLMEKENRRRRDEGIREFNDAIRSLVAFVRKRDPRVPLTQESEADRQRILQEAAASQAARSRAENRAKIATSDEIPEWMRSSEPPETQISDDDEPLKARDEIECTICGKSFKSEKQYQSHANSKKHLKAVQAIKRQMHRDAENLELSEDQHQNSERSGTSPQGEAATSHRSLSPSTETYGAEIESHQTMFNSQEEEFKSSSDVSSDSLNHDELFDEENLSHLHITPADSASDCIHNQASEPTRDAVPDGNTVKTPKKGKAKEKRAKKAAKLANNEDGDTRTPGHICRVCNTKFASKTKLFSHLDQTGHASASSIKDSRRGKKP